jgi:hypothetical protein
MCSRGEGGHRRLFLRCWEGSKSKSAGVVGGVLITMELKKGLSVGVPILVRLTNVLVPQCLITRKILPVSLGNVDRRHRLKRATRVSLGIVFAAGFVHP